MKQAMTRWLQGRTPRTLAVLVLALSVSGASAAKLPVKTIEMMDDGTWRELVEQVGEGMTRGGGGQIVKRTVTKIPGKIPWGGVISWGAPIIQAVINESFDTLRTAGSESLKRWLETPNGFPQPETVNRWNANGTPSQFDYFYERTVCHGYDKNGAPVVVYTMARSGGSGYTVRYSFIDSAGNTVRSNAPGSYPVTSTQANTIASQFCSGLSPAQPYLADVVRANPSDGSLIGNQIERYMKNNPDAPVVRQLYESPVPTINQYESDLLVTPTIVSVPGSRYGDGDYLQEGTEPQPGNRKHPLDGDPIVPWIDSPTPIDIDDDGVPDWRDGDDNGDGVPDDKQDETDQKSRPGDPGYGRRQGDTSNTTTVTEEPIEGGNRRTVTTTTSGPTGGTTRKTVTDTVTKKTYQPGTPAVPATPPGPNGEPGTPGTPGKPGTIITNTTITTTTTTTTTNTTNNTTNTTTNTTTHTENKSEPGPTPQPGDDDGDGKPNEEDPHPNDPIPEQEEEKKGKDGPGGQPYFDQGNLPRWKSDPLTLAIQRNQKELADLKSDRLPFAIGKLFPTLGGVVSSCPDVSVVAGGGLPAVQLVVCESAPAQWMHGAGRSLMAFVLTCIFLVAVVRTVANS